MNGTRAADDQRESAWKGSFLPRGPSSSAVRIKPSRRSDRGPRPGRLRRKPPLCLHRHGSPYQLSMWGLVALSPSRGGPRLPTPGCWLRPLLLLRTGSLLPLAGPPFVSRWCFPTAPGGFRPRLSDAPVSSGKPSGARAAGLAERFGATDPMPATGGGSEPAPSRSCPPGALPPSREGATTRLLRTTHPSTRGHSERGCAALSPG